MDSAHPRDVINAPAMTSSTPQPSAEHQPHTDTRHSETTSESQLSEGSNAMMNTKDILQEGINGKEMMMSSGVSVLEAPPMEWNGCDKLRQKQGLLSRLKNSLHLLSRKRSATMPPPPPTSIGLHSQTNGEHLEMTPRPQISEEPAMVNTEDVGPDDIVIAVIGPTGSGKSTFVRLASGHDAQRTTHDLTSCPTDILAIRFRDQESGRHVVLVDTPGFDDVFKSDLDILNMISDWLNSSCKKGSLLSGILYLHRITDNRMAGTPLKNLRVFRKLCGKDALDKVYLTTTMWDEVDQSTGEGRLEELKTDYWRSMVMQGAQVVRCQNDECSAKKIIQQIVSQVAARKGLVVPRQVTDLQELKKTEPRNELYHQLERLVERQIVLLNEIDKERKAASDASVLEKLRKEYDDLADQVDSKLRQKQELRPSWLEYTLRFLLHGGE